MPKFSRRSLDRLYTCHPDIQKICFNLIKNFDFTVLCGHRNEIEQNKAFDEGKSKLIFPFSLHNKKPSLAIDLCPYPIDWNDMQRFTYLAGHIQGVALANGIKLRWGGNWERDNDLKNNKFNDLPHFELVI